MSSKESLAPNEKKRRRPLRAFPVSLSHSAEEPPEQHSYFPGSSPAAQLDRIDLLVAYHLFL